MYVYISLSLYLESRNKDFLSGRASDFLSVRLGQAEPGASTPALPCVVGTHVLEPSLAASQDLNLGTWVPSDVIVTADIVFCEAFLVGFVFSFQGKYFFAFVGKRFFCKWSPASGSAYDKINVCVTFQWGGSVRGCCVWENICSVTVLIYCAVSGSGIFCGWRP